MTLQSQSTPDPELAALAPWFYNLHLPDGRPKRLALWTMRLSHGFEPTGKKPRRVRTRPESRSRRRRRPWQRRWRAVRHSRRWRTSPCHFLAISVRSADKTSSRKTLSVTLSSWSSVEAQISQALNNDERQLMQLRRLRRRNVIEPKLRSPDSPSARWRRNDSPKNAKAAQEYPLGLEASG